MIAGLYAVKRNISGHNFANGLQNTAMSKKRPVADRYYSYAHKVARKALARQLQNYLNDVDVDLSVMVNRSILIEPLIEIYIKIGLVAAAESYKLTRSEKEFGLIDFLTEGWRNYIRDYAQTYAYRISNELSQTTKQTIQRIIEVGKEMKLTNTSLAKMIYKEVSEINEARSRNIARTESTSASNYGKRLGADTQYQQSGQNGYKYWVHGKAKEPRRTHLAMVDNKPIPINQKFNVGGELMDYPGDVTASAKNRCNCTCTVNYISEALYLRRYVNN